MERMGAVGRIPGTGRRQDQNNASQQARGALLRQTLAALLPHGFHRSLQVTYIPYRKAAGFICPCLQRFLCSTSSTLQQLAGGAQKPVCARNCLQTAAELLAG